MAGVKRTVLQAEAERRRREAGKIQAMENGLRSCLFVCMYVGFSRISHERIQSGVMLLPRE